MPPSPNFSRSPLVASDPPLTILKGVHMNTYGANAMDNLGESGWLRGVERCAADLLWEAGIDAPPVDAFLLADRLGLLVTGSGPMPQRARLARLAGGRGIDGDGGSSAVLTIALRPDDRPERRHWAVAHEIGEAFAWRVFDLLDGAETPPADARERVANALASCLLAPRRWFLPACDAADGDLGELKRVFSTASYEVLARRMLALEELPHIISVFDQGRCTWRSSNVGGATPKVQPLESACQMRTHRAGRLVDTPRHEGPLRRVRCWPVHEPHWRREVLRTDLCAG